MATFDQFDTVVVPFPFADKKASKRRPALILSSSSAFGDQSGCSVMAMITSKHHDPWPLDVPIADLDEAGLRVPSIIRMKLFTLDHTLIIRHLGSLGPEDQHACEKVLDSLFSTHTQTAALSLH